jgi:hypothetical protein
VRAKFIETDSECTKTGHIYAVIQHSCLMDPWLSGTLQCGHVPACGEPSSSVVQGSWKRLWSACQLSRILCCTTVRVRLFPKQWAACNRSLFQWSTRGRTAWKSLRSMSGWTGLNHYRCAPLFGCCIHRLGFRCCSQHMCCMHDVVTDHAMGSPHDSARLATQAFFS